MGTKIAPAPFDCYRNALPHEQMFIVLARDEASPSTIRYWCLERVKRGKNTWKDPQITEAMECARKMEEQHAAIRAELHSPQHAIAEAEKAIGNTDLDDGA